MYYARLVLDLTRVLHKPTRWCDRVTLLGIRNFIWQCFKYENVFQQNVTLTLVILLLTALKYV